MATVDGYALPKPGVPKTLGILNVIFAVLLILGGVCIGASTLLAPAFVQIAQKAQDDVKTQAEARKVADLKILDDREKAATNDEEKATIAKERDVVNARQAPVVPNFAAGTEVLKDPRIISYNVGLVVSGLIIHIILLVAGIGLIRLTSWGRSLGVWWAGLQIAQLLILAVINFSMILPIQRAANANNAAELKKAAEQPNAPPNAAMAAQIAESSSQLAIPMAVAYFVAGMVYPIICLVLLQTPGARAACAPRGPNLPPSTGYGSV